METPDSSIKSASTKYECLPITLSSTCKSDIEITSVFSLKMKSLNVISSPNVFLFSINSANFKSILSKSSFGILLAITEESTIILLT